MTTYTVTKEQQQSTNESLSDLFDIDRGDIHFEDYDVETVPWHSGVSQSRPGPKNGMYGKKRPDLAAHNTARIGKEFHTEESKQKIRDAMTGENNPMYGGTHTEEAKRKIAESGCNKGKWLGRKHSEESKQKMREAKMKKREG